MAAAATSELDREGEFYPHRLGSIALGAAAQLIHAEAANVRETVPLDTKEEK